MLQSSCWKPDRGLIWRDLPCALSLAISEVETTGNRHIVTSCFLLCAPPYGCQRTGCQLSATPSLLTV